MIHTADTITEKKDDLLMSYEKYSVLMPLYVKDDPDWFRVSVDSMLHQTVPPDEIFIICDGPLSKELDTALEDYTQAYPGLFTIHRIKENVGLGNALAKAVPLCRNELIARMDADDFAVPERCEKQLRVYAEHPELSVVGTNVEEFVGDIDNVVSHVVLPEHHDEIVAFAKRRCPIRHPALMYRQSAVIKAGNYRDYRHAQDYNLIVYMILSGAKMYNIQEYLMYMRVNPDFYKRRGGVKQAKLVLKLKKEFRKCGFYSRKDYIISGYGNAFVAILPNKIRESFYKKILRKKEG